MHSARTRAAGSAAASTPALSFGAAAPAAGGSSAAGTAAASAPAFGLAGSAAAAGGAASAPAGAITAAAGPHVPVAIKVGRGLLRRFVFDALLVL